MEPLPRRFRPRADDPLDSWGDPRTPFTLDGVEYQLVEGPDLYVLYAQPPEEARAAVARFGPSWHPRDVYTAAVCHRFHLIGPP